MKTVSLFALLAVGIAARLLLQMSVLPPYAGLDEAYHVARLSFVADEGRNPNDREASIPSYIHRSLALHDGVPPAFPAAGERWPDIATGPYQDVSLASGQQDYLGPNYEAQQPSLYYSATAPLVRLAANRTQLGELRVWRFASVFAALMTVMAAGLIGWRFFGAAGLVAAALIASFPTWLTLVVRASSDALACAFLAVAFAATLRQPRTWSGWLLEAVAWSAALATKLFTWPAGVVLLAAWRFQKAGPRRVAIVGLACAASVLMTLLELQMRTGHPLGLFAFDRAPVTAEAVPIDYIEMAKIWIATAVWTSGQHWNALKPAAMAVYFVPILVVFAMALLRGWKQPESRRLLVLLFLTVVAFAGAQAVNAWGYIKAAHASGASLPAGGKEGWYWYSLAPLLMTLPAGIAFTCSKHRRLLLLVLTAWITCWDVVISEGGVFRDYAGLTRPNRPSLLFRWGGAANAEPLYRRVELTGTGPLAEYALHLRVVHLVAIGSVAIIAAARLRQKDPLPA